MAVDPPIGEAQTALRLVSQMRSLLACEGWAGMREHLIEQRDALAARILDDDSLSGDERETLRVQYKVFRDLVNWPQQALEAQQSVLERSGGSDDPSLPV